MRSHLSSSCVYVMCVRACVWLSVTGWVGMAFCACSWSAGHILIYLKPSAECACHRGSKSKLPLMVQVPTLVLNQFFVCGQYGNSEPSVSVFILVKVPLFIKYITLKIDGFFPSIRPSIHSPFFRPNTGEREPPQFELHGYRPTKNIIPTPHHYSINVDMY